MSGKNGISVHTLSETRSAHARAVIDELSHMSGETFGRDPFCIELLKDHADLKMALSMKALVYGNGDPDFTLFYVYDNEAASAGRDPFKSCSFFNVGRDDRGFVTSLYVYVLFFFYCLPHVCAWGLRGFCQALAITFRGLYRCALYGELAQHLGVEMKDCYALENVTTRLEDLGKGYGSEMMKALLKMADSHKKHVILYSSNKKNVSFYERHGFKTQRNHGANCTLLYRRYEEQ